MISQFQDWLDWVVGHLFGEEGDPAQSVEAIETTVDTVFSSFGTLTTDVGDIPTTATARPRGAFTDPHDMQNYLDGGSLVQYDADGNVIPNPIVYILKQQAPDSAVVIYEVWIDDESPKI